MKIKFKHGVMWENGAGFGRTIFAPEADRIAKANGYPFAEKMAEALEGEMVEVNEHLIMVEKKTKA